MAQQKMTKERMGEIALIRFKMEMNEKGVHLGDDFKRKMGSEAQKAGITTEEAMLFVETVFREMLDETFKK